jgi:hypothetical protein
MIDRRTLAECFDSLRMLRHAIVQERAIRACGKAWQQGCNRSLDVANDPQLHRTTAAEVGRLDVDLNDASFFGVELPPREIAAQQKQGVAAHQCAVARGDAEDTGHADVEGIVVLEADPVTGADDRLEERLRALRRHHVAGGVAGTCFKADVPLAPLVLPIGHVALRSVSLGYRCRRPIFGVLRGLFD